MSRIFPTIEPTIESIIDRQNWEKFSIKASWQPLYSQEVKVKKHFYINSEYLNSCIAQIILINKFVCLVGAYSLRELMQNQALALQRSPSLKWLFDFNLNAHLFKELESLTIEYIDSRGALLKTTFTAEIQLELERYVESEYLEKYSFRQNLAKQKHNPYDQMAKMLLKLEHDTRVKVERQRLEKKIESLDVLTKVITNKI